MDSPGNAFLVEGLDALLAGPLAPGSTAPKVHLAAAAFAAGPNLTPSSFTEATFVGYSALVIAGYLPAHLVPQGGAIAEINSVAHFSPTADTTPNTIYGWWIDDHAGNVVCCGNFNPPRPMNVTTDLISFVPAVGMGPWSFTTALLP